MDGGARRGGAAASGKRDQGIKKKAWELVTLCGVDVCLLGVDPAGNLFFWPDDVNELRGITHRYLDAIRGGGGGESPGTKEKKRKRAPAERKKMHGRGSLANEDVASSSQAGIGSLVPSPPPAVPLPSLVVWIHTSPTPATAVGLDDYGGDVGEDLLCLIRSPSWEDLPPFDMEPQPTTEDGGGGGGFPIPGGVLFPLQPAAQGAAFSAHRPRPSFPRAWSCTSPATAAATVAVDLEDFGGHAGEDLRCLMCSSPSREELPCDLVLLPTLEDASGEFPILGGVLFPTTLPPVGGGGSLGRILGVRGTAVDGGWRWSPSCLQDVCC